MSKINIFIKAITMLLEWMSKHWIIITASFTLTTSLIGVVSSTIYYSDFNVSYLAFADTGDYVRDGILRPHIAISVFIINILMLLPIFKILIELNYVGKVKDVTINYKVKISSKIKFILKHLSLFVFVLIIFIFSRSVYYNDSERVKSEIAQLYNVYADGSNLTCVSHVGRINNFQIFWNSQNSEAVMIQSSLIKTITPKVKLKYSIDPHADIVMVFPYDYERWKGKIEKECGSTFNISMLKEQKKMMM